jgi:hypothetical protein
MSRPELFEKKAQKIPNYLRVKGKSETGRGFAGLCRVIFFNQRKDVKKSLTKLY